MTRSAQLFAAHVQRVGDLGLREAPRQDDSRLRCLAPPVQRRHGSVRALTAVPLPVGLWPRHGGAAALAEVIRQVGETRTV